MNVIYNIISTGFYIIQSVSPRNSLYRDVRHLDPPSEPNDIAFLQHIS